MSGAVSPWRVRRPGWARREKRRPRMVIRPSVLRTPQGLDCLGESGRRSVGEEVFSPGLLALQGHAEWVHKTLARLANAHPTSHGLRMYMHLQADCGRGGGCTPYGVRSTEQGWHSRGWETESDRGPICGVSRKPFGFNTTTTPSIRSTDCAVTPTTINKIGASYQEGSN